MKLDDFNVGDTVYRYFFGSETRGKVVGIIEDGFTGFGVNSKQIATVFVQWEDCKNPEAVGLGLFTEYPPKNGTGTCNKSLLDKCLNKALKNIEQAKKVHELNEQYMVHEADYRTHQPFKVVMFAGSITRETGMYGSNEDCYEYCNEQNWIADEGFVWDLEIVENPEYVGEEE